MHILFSSFHYTLSFLQIILSWFNILLTNNMVRLKTHSYICENRITRNSAKSLFFLLLTFLASYSCLDRRELMLVWSFLPLLTPLVSLTQTKQKGKEHKDNVVNTVRECVDNYKFVYVLEFDNLRTNAFKDLRLQLNDCRYSPLFTVIILGFCWARTV